VKNHKNTTIVVIANGKTPKSGLLNKLVSQADIIVAADGGSNICHKNGIVPDYIVGDLDSIKQKTKSFFKEAEIVHCPDQNETDLLKTLKFCEALKPEKVIVTAITGKRFDQSISNIFILQSANFEFEVRFYDDYGITSIISKEKILELPLGQTISLFSFKPVYGITLEGFKYPLKNQDFPDGLNGVSNEIVKSPAKVFIRKGSLITYILHANN